MATRAQKLQLKQQLSGLTDEEWGQFSESELDRIEAILNSPDTTGVPFGEPEEFRSGGPPSIFTDRAIEPPKSEPEPSWLKPETYGPAASSAIPNAPGDFLELGKQVARPFGLYGDEQHPAGLDWWKEFAGMAGALATQGQRPIGPLSPPPAGYQMLQGARKQLELSELAKHPVQGLATAATLGMPVARVAGAGPLVRGATTLAADPWQGMLKGAVRGAQAAKQTAPVRGVLQAAKTAPGAIASESLGLLTGAGGGGLRELGRAAFESPTMAKVAETARLSDQPSTAIGGQVISRVDRKYKAIGRLEDRVLQDAKAQGITLPTDPIKQVLFGDFVSGGPEGLLASDAFDIRLMGGARIGPAAKESFVLRQGGQSRLVRFKFPENIPEPDQKKIRAVAEKIAKLGQDISVVELDELKKGLYGYSATTPHAGQVISEMAGSVRETLRAIPEYNQVMQRFEDFHTTTGEISGRLSKTPLRVRGRESVTDRTAREIKLDEELQRGFEPMYVAGQKPAAEALSSLAKMFPGMNLPTKVAGQRYTSWTPKGLLGHGQLAQLIPNVARIGATGGAIAAGGPWAGLAMLPLYLPRFAGWAAVRTGAGARRALALQTRVDKLAAQVSRGGQPIGQSVTIGNLLQRSGLTLEDLLQDTEE